MTEHAGIARLETRLVLEGGGGDPRGGADAGERLFPRRQIVQIDIDGIAAGGGGMHCTTPQVPSPKRVGRVRGRAM